MGDMSAATDENSLALLIAQSASRYRAAESAVELGQIICEVALEVVPQAEHASVSYLLKDGQIDTVAVTSEVCEVVDRYQEEHEDGPCADAARHSPVTHLPDTGHDDRWPGFSRWAAEQGVGSMMAVQLTTYEADETHPEGGRAGLGALNLYAAEPLRFDAEAERRARLVAAVASVGLSSHQHVAQLTEAIASRDLIGQAKGILMARLQLSDDAAFDVLRERSRHTNVRLVEVARAVVGGATAA